MSPFEKYEEYKDSSSEEAEEMKGSGRFGTEEERVIEMDKVEDEEEE